VFQRWARKRGLSIEGADGCASGVLIAAGLLQWWSVDRMEVSGQGFVGGLVREGINAGHSVARSQGRC